MITITHGKNTVSVSGLNLASVAHDETLFEAGWKRGKYAIGREPANYPVPSIYCFSEISLKVDRRVWDMNITHMMLETMFK